jgi:hypothetical protein
MESCNIAESPDFADTSANVLAKLCQESPSTTIRNLLRLYNPKKNTKDIRAKLNSCSKDDLVMALDYLGVSNQVIYIKESVAHNLICRIENLLPDKCGICEQIYCTNLPCKKCGQEAHRECVQDITSSNQIEDIPAIMAAIPGLHYLCPTCEIATIPEQGTLLKSIQKQRSNTTPEVTILSQSSLVKSTKSVADGLDNPDIQHNEQERADADSTQSSQVPAPSTYTSETADVEVGAEQNTSMHIQVTNKSRNNCPNQPICRHFLKGNCIHGMSGKSNNGCKYRHLKTCNKILKHGTRGKYGCNKGNKCEHFHPKMCSSSLIKGVCFDPECNLNHVKGTKRIDEKQKPPVKTNTAESLPLHASQHGVNHPISNASQSTAQRTSNENVSKQNDSVDFLSMMCSMKEEIMRALDLKLTSLLPLIQPQSIITRPSIYPQQPQTQYNQIPNHAFLQSQQNLHY